MLIVFTSADAQNVHIPDQNFKSYLLSHGSINTNGDDEIQVSEAEAYTGEIFCGELNIADLTGIEAFINLTNLRAEKNALTFINVQNNIHLTHLYCDNNQISSIDVSNNIKLVDLRCFNNTLSTLDVTNNPLLVTLGCEGNLFTQLDVSQNPLLKNLVCFLNQITSLDLNNNPHLELLLCHYNELSTLDLSNNPSLLNVNCSNNVLTSIAIHNSLDLLNLDCSHNMLTDLNLLTNTKVLELRCASNQLPSLNVTNNTELNVLACNHNNLETLDLTNNSMLQRFFGNNNQLLSLNLKNGNNAEFTEINLTNNPSLTCIKVDDPAFSQLNWTGSNFNFDSQHTFDTDCIIVLDGEYCSNAINADQLFGHDYNMPITSVQINNTGYNNDDDPTTGIDCLFNGIFTSIWFTFTGDGNTYRIKSSQCNAPNPLLDPRTAVYSGSCSGLVPVACHDDISLPGDLNFLVEFPTTPGVNYYFFVDGFNSTSGNFCLEVTNLTDTCMVTIPDANFKSYLVGNSAINTNGDSEIQCSEAEAFSGTIGCSSLGIHDLTGIEAFINLKLLNCSGNNLTTLNINSNTALVELYCALNNLTSIDVSNNVELELLSIGGNKLTALNISNLTKLGFLACHVNELTSLNVSNNTSLETIFAHSNKLVELDFTVNTNLKSLYVFRNNLTSLNLRNGNNGSLTEMDATFNSGLTCILVDDPVAAATYPGWKIDATSAYYTVCPAVECPPGNVVLTSQAEVDQFIIDYPNCTEIVGFLEIINNTNIGNLNGLSNIESIGGYLFISNNSALANLNGLGSLTNVGEDIDIQSNAVLSDASALQNASFHPTASLGLTIVNNPVLSVCNLPNFCTYLANPAATHPRTISGNAGDCITEQDVINACNEPDCPDGDLNLYSQDEVNQFAIDYPTCTHIEGNLQIDGNSITDLSPLSNIVSIAGVLSINSASLTNLNGLNNLTIVTSSIVISDNGLLTDISALQNVNPAAIGGDQGLTITNNPALLVCDLPNFCTYLSDISNPRTIYGNAGNCYSMVTLAAACTIQAPECPTGNVIFSQQSEIVWFEINYPNCTHISGDLGFNDGTDEGNAFWDLTPVSNLITIAGDLYVLGSQTLGHLDGLHNLTSIGGSLKIQSNRGLSDISALININPATIGGAEGLFIKDNVNLEVCNLPNFCTYLANPAATHPRTISGNAGDCITEQAVLDACDGTGVDGDHCSDAVDIQFLFGHPQDEPQRSGTYSTSGMTSDGDPDFGEECLNDNRITMWFAFSGDGARYYIRSRDCSAHVSTDPNGALYGGSCDALDPITCHRDIWLGDIDIDINFHFTLQTEIGRTYYILVEVESTDDFTTYNNYGDFCLEVTKLGEECIVTIPDANFKEYVLSNSEINTNFDSEIQCEEAEAFSGVMDCSGLEIADLTGIEAFKYVTSLNCSDNQLTVLNVSQNKALGQLACNHNLLSELDISQNPALYRIWCNDNLLTSLNLANGINEDFSGVEAFNNPGLTCIQVDNAENSILNWTGGNFLFDAHHEFSKECIVCEHIDPDFLANFLVSGFACVGDQVHFIDYSIPDIEESATFNWDFGDGATSSERDPVHEYTDPGHYSVKLELSIAACETPYRLTKNVRVLFCLQDIPGENQYSKVYPNPTNGPARFEVRLPLDSDVFVNVVSTRGEEIMYRHYRSVSDMYDDLLITQKGAFIVIVRHALGIENHKLIVLE